MVGILLSIGLPKAYAQSFDAGLVGGATFCQVDGDKYFGYHKLGFTAGAYASYPLSDHFALRMELKYTLMGAHSSVEEAELPNYGPYNLNLHYAEIPVMVQYDFGYFTIGGKSLDFLALEAGISFDMLMKYRGELDSSQQSWKFNFFSITGNYGLRFNITEHLSLGARMMYSITPMQTNPNPIRLFDHAYNKVIQFTLAYNLYSPLR